VPNRLADEPSLYLRQHADQPVDWRPWGAEAFAEARRRDVPVLVSIGYASCHWCHVMSRECFDDPWIADLMNRHFVCVKVDREERPDVDQLHMDAVQMIQHHGGWPLNSFCLPDGRPFFGGTYFPPDDRGGRTPWPQVLMRVAEHYRSRRQELEANADAVVGNLLHQARSPAGEAGETDAAGRLAAARALLGDADPANGGFGGAPKFPPPMTLDFLLALRERPDLDGDTRAAIDRTVGLCLRRMDEGGLHDQVGGGFHRYCVDADWTVPHFEKLLCDNALLLGTYAKAAVALGEPRFREVCAGIVGWLEREMRVGPAYAASLDADTGHEEGLTYLWTPGQVAAVLGPEAEAFCAAHGITPGGNLDGASVPTFRTGADRRTFAQAAKKLREARARRPQPARDDKVLAGWNALLAANLARAGLLLGEPAWVARADTLLDHLAETVLHRDGAALAVRAVAGSTAPGTLADHAWLAEACLTLAVTGGEGRIRLAAELVEGAFARLGDPRAAGLHTSDDPEGLLPVRQKPWWDQAVPAGNSALLAALAGLRALGIEGADARFRSLAAAYGGAARQMPHGVPRALAALERAAQGIPVVKLAPGTPPPHAALGDLRGEILCHPEPHLATGLQLCLDGVCHPPAGDAAQLRPLLPS
jgi:uncharacterized protein